MVYLYAYTNFKDGLDSLRRVKVIYERLKEEGIESEILLNEYRAQLLAKEWGLPLATTIETIKDIDAVVEDGNIVVIDSTEEISGKVLDYPKRFRVIYLNSSCKSVNFEGAEVINLFKDGILVPDFKDLNPKNSRAIFIYGDSDYEKRILKYLDEFRGLELDIYWGIYFFVKYEDIIKEVFKNIVESEDYYEIFKNYSKILTSSFQVATEFFFNNYETIFLNINDSSKECLELLDSYGIKVIDTPREIDFSNSSKKVNFMLKNLDSQILDIIKTYM